MGLAGRLTIIAAAGNRTARGIAELFAAEGARAAEANIGVGAAQGAAAQVTARGGTAIAINADVRDPTSVKRLLPEVRDLSVDLLARICSHLLTTG